MTTTLSVHRLTKDFGETRALDAVDLTVEDGRFLCLLGPSGCGKTTLLRAIAGITPATAGEIRLNGDRIDDLPPEKRNFGMVFQTYALFPHMSVRRNVGFGLEMRRVKRADAQARVAEALRLVGLDHLAGRLPRALSGGQQQRVALARAIVIEPDLLLFDEPLSNLDAKLRDSLREELRALQRQLGITSIYVTHDQAEAMALADEIVVMDNGRIIERGAPVDLYRRPKYRFTADFLGLTNVIETRSDGRAVHLPWGADSLLETARPPGTVHLAVRPEDLDLARAASEPHGTVTDAVFLGAQVLYHVQVGDRSLRVSASGGDRAVLPPGTPVHIAAPSRLHSLDVADG